MVDPRLALIEERLSGIHRIIAVSSAKGGVGKSLVATLMALTLSQAGRKVGLLDLDFTGPSSHIILGVGELQPAEERGLLPPEVYGFEYMSIVFYSGGRPSPLRGVDISNALVELLAVTKWGKLDFLIVDMPPGLTDATMDVLRFVERVEFLLVTTPSRLVFETVRKLLALLSELEVPVIGVIENMKTDDSEVIMKEVDMRGIPYWGDLPLDLGLEETLGSVENLIDTAFGKRLQIAVRKNLV